MTKTTATAVRAILGADPTVTTEEIDATISALSNKGAPHRAAKTYTAQEVANLLGVGRRTVRNYARRGLLVPIKAGAKGERARAYAAASVEKLVNGNG